MKNARRLLKLLLMTVATLITGFLALALPFRLFSSLNSDGLWIMFAIEVLVYFVISMVFIFVKEKKRAEKEKQEQRRFQRRLKFEQAQREYYDLVA